MNNALKNGFPPFLNEQSLRLAIESICAKFGRVRDQKIVPASRGLNLQCVCLLQLHSAAAQSALKSKLHVAEFEPNLAFFADVDETWTGPTI
jgi:hypothetical protein